MSAPHARPGAAIEQPDTDTMLVSVRLFAVLRERAAADSLELRLARGATVADALAALAEQAGLGEPLAQLPVVMAVNREYADPGTPLRADDELALIPPLSGGSQRPGERTATPRERAPAADRREHEDDERVHVRVDSEPPSHERVRAAVADPRAGAIVTFEGVTRELAQLDYEAYVEMAGERIARIMRECVREHALCAAAAEHRVGVVTLGQPSVIVAVSAPHREAAFAGARRAIDRIKAEAPIWKREPAGRADEGWVPGTPAPIASAAGRPARSPAGPIPDALTHLGGDGAARMVDVGAKPASERVARARARVLMSAMSAHALQEGNGPKGDVVAVARIAGIQAAKQTAQLIPLAHPLALSFVDVAVGIDADAGVVELHSEARTVASTGVEMEAMTACAVAALAVYDMVKGLERGVALEQVVLMEKRGGRSDYKREEE